MMRTFLVPIVLLTTVVACSSGDESDPAADTSTTVIDAPSASGPSTSAPSATIDSSDTAAGDTPAGVVAESATVTAVGVLAAAILLAEGDVEQAVADGIVTADEVDAAVAAIEAGTLKEWAVLAED